MCAGCNVLLTLLNVFCCFLICYTYLILLFTLSWLLFHFKDYMFSIFFLLHNMEVFIFALLFSSVYDFLCHIYLKQTFCLAEVSTYALNCQFDISLLLLFFFFKNIFCMFILHVKVLSIKKKNVTRHILENSVGYECSCKQFYWKGNSFFNKIHLL